MISAAGLRQLFQLPLLRPDRALVTSFIVGCCQIQGARYLLRAQKMFGWIVGIVVFAVAISSDALSQQSLQQLESMNQFEQALAAVDAIKQRKKIQCVMAIANGALCACLARKLPVSTYFRSYASIAKQEKEGLEYGQLSAADKKIVDQCISDSP